MMSFLQKWPLYGQGCGEGELFNGSGVLQLGQGASTNFAETNVLKGGRGSKVKPESIFKFVNQYKDDKVFQQITGRVHGHFKHVQAKALHQEIHKPEKLAERLQKYSHELDKAIYASKLGPQKNPDPQQLLLF
jgi:hypothetical protein